jgi:PAS domain-containing protein
MNSGDKLQDLSKSEIIALYLQLNSQFNALKAEYDKPNNKAGIYENAGLTRSIIKTFPFGIDIVNESGEIIFANEILKQEFGDDIQGKICWELFKPDKKQCANCPLRNKLETGKTEVCEASLFKGDKIFEIYHTAFEHNGQFSILEIFKDVTKQKQLERDLIRHKNYIENLVEERTIALEHEKTLRNEAENALLETETRYRNIVDYSTSIILEWDTDGNILFLNKYGLDFFGYLSGELYGRHVVGTIVEPYDTDG